MFHTKQKRPSRLRHELRPDSTDEDRDNKVDIIQEPNSDTIVLDTQPDVSRHANEHSKSKDPESHSTETPLSPNSKVTLERFGATKKTNMSKYDTTLFKAFSKEPMETRDDLSLSSQTFSFGRPIRAISQTIPRIGSAELQSTARTTWPSSTKEEEGCDRTVHDSVVPVTIENSPRQETPVYAQDSRNILRTKEPGPSISPPPLLATDNYIEQAGNFEPRQSETPLLFPLPTQPISQLEKVARKNTRFERYRRVTKGSPAQPHARLWLPQQSDTLGDVEPLTEAKGILPSESIGISDPPKLGQHDNQLQGYTGDDAILSLAIHDSSKPARGYDVHKPNTREDTQKEHVTDPKVGKQEVSPKVPLDILDISATSPVLTSSFPPAPVFTRQCFVTNLAQQNLQEDHDETNKSNNKRNASSNQAIIPPPEPRNDTSLCNGGSGDDLLDIQSRIRVNENSQIPTAQPSVSQSQEALHRVSSRGVPHRIVKPRMKSRTDSKFMSHGFHGASMLPLLERGLKDLELEILAESFRKNHEHTTQLNHAEEKIALHLQKIDLQKEIIADIRKQRDELRTAFDSLTKKAKTNQKFLEGIQKDHEKIKRMATSAEIDNKKVLQATIAELEAEKHTIRREFEIAACKLSESQRKMRSLADELYVKLTITHSANESLTKRLGELEEAYKSEKKQREDLEIGLLNGFQNLQCQLRNSSDALISKLEQVQTSIGKTAPHDNQDAEIKECLGILNNMKISSLLTVKDVRKAEGMLCFMRTRVESGLEDVQRAMMCVGFSNTNLHTSINEELQNLRTIMMKYVEVAAENCKIKESSVALAQQLDAQKQQCAHLIETVEHLKQIELDLKGRSGELEHELNSLKTATHSSKSAVEKLNCDLRDRLMEVENELMTTKAKAGDAEDSRKNLETQAAEYKTRYEAIVKEQMAEKRNAAATREKLSEEFELKLSEQQQELQREISRLKLNLHEKEMTCQKLSEDLGIANIRLEELRKLTHHQEDANIKLKAQVSPQQSTMKVMRQEADGRASRMQEEAQRILELTQNKVALLENEKQNLFFELSQACENENRMKKVEESISAERDRLHQEIQNMTSEIANKDAEMTQIRSKCANEHEKVIEQYRNDVVDYKRRLAETATSLKEAEANARLLADQYQARISTGQWLAESKLLELEKEYHNALQLVKEQNISSEQQNDFDTSSSPHSGQQFPTSKGRKSVNRDNQSVIEAIQKQDHDLQLPILAQPESSSVHSEDQDLFAAFIEDTSNFLQDAANDDSMAKKKYEPFPATQDLGSSPFSQTLFADKQVEAATKEAHYQILSSSGFSSVSSNELAEMQREVESASTPNLHGKNITSCRVQMSLGKEKTGVSQVDNVSVTSSHSSKLKERPRSQANTSSRMLPPHGSSKQIQPRGHSRIIRIKLPRQHEKLDSILQKLSGSVSSEKRKISTSQTEDDLTSKRQRGMSISQPATSLSSSRRRSPRLSRSCVGGSGDTSHAKGDLSTVSLSRFKGRSWESQPCSSNYISSDKTYPSQQQLPYTNNTLPKCHSSRVTRNQSRNGTAFGDGFNDRFNEELQGLD